MYITFGRTMIVFRCRAETFPKIWIRIRATLGYVVTEPRHAMCHLVLMGVRKVGGSWEKCPPPPEIGNF